MGKKMIPGIIVLALMILSTVADATSENHDSIHIGQNCNTQYGNHFWIINHGNMPIMVKLVVTRRLYSRITYEGCRQEIIAARDSVFVGQQSIACQEFPRVKTEYRIVKVLDVHDEKEDKLSAQQLRLRPRNLDQRSISAYISTLQNYLITCSTWKEKGFPYDRAR